MKSAAADNESSFAPLAASDTERFFCASVMLVRDSGNKRKISPGSCSFVKGFSNIIFPSVSSFICPVSVSVVSAPTCTFIPTRKPFASASSIGILSTPGNKCSSIVTPRNAACAFSFFFFNLSSSPLIVGSSVLSKRSRNVSCVAASPACASSFFA